MTQEEKDLLLKDLCGRLPYETKINCGTVKPFHTLQSVWVDNEYNVVNITDDFGLTFNIEEVQPYLRPMSSMTMSEELEFTGLCLKHTGKPEIENMVIELSEFYNKKHLDYRGLIEKGLALEAPEGMYKTK